MNILVVDDDIPSARMTSYLLEEAGYRVFRAHDASNILQLIEQHNPDLILLDVMMPKIDGFEVCRQIRRNSDIPIIFLSARHQLQDRVKPFEPSELLARVEAVLRRRNADVLNTSTRLSQGNITLDPVEHKVLFTDGRVVELTPLEFRLLYYLMKNSGRILNVTQILSKVWGYDYEGESNLVAVYIRRLRTKVEEDPDHPRHVITVRNLGYKFEP